ncbi:hypothetical protein [Exiguobacterium chiriqhucha]|uniref:hypothetical protein n=1 Tax=Exiguobacterium chiriqhucha TaxID=1385984 RepID=UPI0004984581|nr:hypothetical protein [Exiguobacterium chiriqhucha]
MEQFNVADFEFKVDNSITRIKEMLSESDPLLTMIQLYNYKFFKGLMNIKETIQGNTNPFENKLLDITQSILVSNQIMIGYDLEDNFLVEEYLEEIMSFYSAASILISFSPKEEIIRYSQGMQFNVTGTLYPLFEQDHFTDMLSPYDQLLQSTFGLTSSNLVSGILAISKHLRSTLYIKFLEDTYGISDDESLIDLHVIADYFDVEKITKWPRTFIKELSLSRGEYKDFYKDNLSIVTKESPIKYKPFLELDGRFYCFSIDNFIDNIYRSTLRVIRANNLGSSNQINLIQNDLSEEISLKLLKKMLPKSKLYKNVFYKAPVGGNGKDEWCECDGIFIFDNVMIIVEVKGGALSPVSPFSDEVAYLKSLDDLAKNPYNQSLRFYNAYKKQDFIELFSKESKRKYQKIAIVSDIKFVQACSVTLDDFNEIASRIEKTDIIQKSDLPIWCISINDLRVYPELFDSPSIFLNYLYQRSKASKNPYIKLNDELDHIGLYFEYNDYSKRVNEVVEEHQEISEVFIDNHREEIDIYMAMKLNSILENTDPDNSSCSLIDGEFQKKPNQKMPKTFQQLINLLDSKMNEELIRVARYLLMLDSGTRENIETFLTSRSRKLLESKRRGEILTPYMSMNYKKENKIEELPVISIFLLHSSNRVFKNETERKRFLMERVFDEDEQTICLVIGINDKAILNKAVVYYIGPEQFKALPLETYERLKTIRIKISEARNIREF